MLVESSLHAASNVKCSLWYRYGLVYEQISSSSYDTQPAVYFDKEQQLCVLLEPVTCREYSATIGMLFNSDDDCPRSVNKWIDGVVKSGYLNGEPSGFVVAACTRC